ncbi:2-phosphosulfolactate phosphatase [Reichenbachiella sp. MALMAid0571]|uniref:2-phosphosulfolactate phosphatase n=1 Tax=Reichenbachiella sp. MALMAid0571 TaxID=3143939 RepID=UPI0032DFB7A2
MARTIDVCFSPDLIDSYDLEGKIVVVVDILRATSCMVSGFASGVKGIIPVATLEECKEYQNKGFICAAERGGKQVDGFELDNSPFSYMNENLKGKTICATTTNGTLAISKSIKAYKVIIGAFLNLSVVALYLNNQPNDVIIHCAGWKGKVNMEDSLFAGALIEKLEKSHTLNCDAPHMALKYYQAVKNELLPTVQNSAHAKRLSKIGINKDIEFCLKIDRFDVIPVLSGSTLVRMD